MPCSRFAALIVVASLILPDAYAQFGFGGGGPKGPEPKAVRSDIQYIKCEVCENLAKQAYRQAGAFKKAAAQKKAKHERKVKELDLLEKIEKIANPLKAEGEWISYLDIVESGDKLVLKEMPEEGRCGTECKTIQKAAESILESADTDIAEKLWQGKLSRSQFTKWLCKEASSSCTRKAPAVPRDRPKGPAFEVVDPEEAKMQKMMATMKEMGMGGQVFDRKQAQHLADGGADDDEDYDDDDDVGLPAAQPKAPSKAAKGSSGVASNLQASLGDAVDAAKGGLDMAKEAGLGLLNKAQNLIAGGSKATAATEL